jgi:hypothetical protein
VGTQRPSYASESAAPQGRGCGGVEDGKRRRVVRAAGKRRRSSGRRRRGIAPDPAATRTFGSKLLSSFFFLVVLAFRQRCDCALNVLTIISFIRSITEKGIHTRKDFVHCFSESSSSVGSQPLCFIPLLYHFATGAGNNNQAHGSYCRWFLSTRKLVHYYS